MTEEFSLTIDGLGQNPRTIYVYLPHDYYSSDKRYPVLYMFDGHNLFYDHIATYGKCWGLKDYCDKKKLELIIVGADCNHTGNNRLHEYCPYPCPDSWLGDLNDQGKITANWFAHTLKPAIDSRYRTLGDRHHTAIAGSSMGGLMSLYTVIRYNEVFSRAACLSSSFSLCSKQLKEEIRHAVIHADTRIYMDHGSSEARNKQGLTYSINTMLELSHECTKKGAETYPRLVVNGTHSEASWEKQVPIFLEYLFA